MDHTHLVGDDSELFIVRLWSDKDSESGDFSHFQGKIQHIKSGKAGGFGDWQALITFMQGMMQETHKAGANKSEGEHEHPPL